MLEMLCTKYASNVRPDLFLRVAILNLLRESVRRDSRLRALVSRISLSLTQAASSGWEVSWDLITPSRIRCSLRALCPRARRARARRAQAARPSVRGAHAGKRAKCHVGVVDCHRESAVRSASTGDRGNRFN